MVIAQVSSLVAHASISGMILLIHVVLLLVLLKRSTSREKMIHNAKFIGMHCAVQLGIVNFGVLRNEPLSKLGIVICALFEFPVFIFWIRGLKRLRETTSTQPSPSSLNNEQTIKPSDHKSPSHN